MPSSQASTKRWPTISGAGRMYGGRPVRTTIAFHAEHEDDEGTDDREPDRARHDTSSDRAVDAPIGSAAAAGPVRAGRVRVGQVGADLACRAAGGRIVEVGDGPRSGDVDRDVGDDAPGSRGQDDDAIGDQDRLGDAVGDHDDGRCRALPEPQQLEVEAFAAERIERAEGFVEQEHGGLERQGTGERDALGGPAGQLGRA